MSRKPTNTQPGNEEYSYAMTRKLFNYTAIGAVLFSVVIIVLWYVF